jgi:hypothetical protein
LKWTKHTGSNKDLLDLPLGTILKVKDENGLLLIKVLGDGEIHNNSCGYPAEGWLYTEADWTSLDASYEVIEFAYPPVEYEQFLENAYING